MNESLRQVLRRHFLLVCEQSGASAKIERALRSASGKPVTLPDTITRRELQTIDYWLNAFTMLRSYPTAKNALTKYVNAIEFIRPEAGEDAVWISDTGTMQLALEQAGYSDRHMLKGLVHEIGHAIEDHIKCNHAVWGRPPFAQNYCNTPGEDFAETFMLYNLDPELLIRTAPLKHQEMERTIGAVQ